MRLCLAALAALILTATTHAADKPKPQSVLVLIADDLGYQLGCYGDKQATTPNIDALAKNGVRFSHAFAAVSSCSPSRATIYTGLHTHTSGQYGLAHATHNFHTRPVMKSLPSYLKTTKYRTGIIGKVHVIPKNVYPWDVETARVNARNGVAMASAAASFFKDQKDKPFVLVMGYTDPHRDRVGFGNAKPIKGIKSIKVDPKALKLPPYIPDTTEARADLADYYQAINRLDQNVGLVMAELKKAGRDKDTLVIFLSDNGPPWPGAKTTLYDTGTRLPLIVSSPIAKKRGIVNNAMVSFIDILPTILDVTGTTIPKTLQGRSFLSILEEEKPKGWDVIFGSHQFHEVTMYYPMRMMRTRTHKVILNLAHQLPYPFASDLYNSPTWQGILKRKDKMMGSRTVAQYTKRPRYELYDLDKDPHELKNLAQDAASAKTLETMSKALRAWQEKTGDPWLVKYKYE